VARARGTSVTGQAPRVVVVGSGPNGLAGAVTLARAGLSVEVHEQAAGIGGGARSAELTLPGFIHDVCSAVHPLAVVSPIFRSLPLEARGLEWIQPDAALAHPLDDGTAVVLERSVDTTAAGLGPDDATYRRLLQRLLDDWPSVAPMVLAPPLRLPRHPIAAARVAARGLRSARAFAEGAFAGERARALFAGLAAHSVLPLERAGTAAVGLVFALTAHTSGWPIPRGGSQRIADALAAELRAHRGTIHVDSPILSLDDISDAVVLCDIGPHDLVRLAGGRLGDSRYRRRLEQWQYGPGVFKLDWALAGPIPWTAQECHRAGTVHVGGTLPEIADSERAAWEGRHVDRPFVLLTQPSLFDASRAPAGKHTAWAYCHVPNGSPEDVTDRIEAQVERFAPGFGRLVLARHGRGPAELESENPNLVGGDITGGAMQLGQLLARPVLRRDPFATPLPGVFLCSSSTPPGPGVHGMCGYWAARSALRSLGRR
jgi:phytoene dehydrogenase-like protein